MSRFDTTGLFWDDYVAPRVAKVKIKRTPPDPVWLNPDYLPELEAAKAYEFNLMTNEEIIEAALRKDRLVWDIECYKNYFLVGFKNIETNKIVLFEIKRGEQLSAQQMDKFIWIMKTFTLIDMNGIAFDVPLAMAFVAGFTTDQLMTCTDELIHGGTYLNGVRPHEFYKTFKLKNHVFYVDHIDLKELTPLGPGLKICAGRMHSPRMADLPFKPGIDLSDDQITILRYYWVNDLDNTHLLYLKNKNAIDLREILTREYKVDVRSKSDPQIAEAVISTEIKRMTGQRYLARAKIEPGRQFSYMPPAYVTYQSATMQWVLDFIRAQRFTVDANGSPTESDELSNLKFVIGNTSYSMGIGGLHSQEKKMIHIADNDNEISDNDVTSYYPSLMIQQGMYPPNIGPAFLAVFKKIYDRRIAAKKSGDKDTAETLKIVLNGTFGKTGEAGGHSIVYYPEMMIQVTLSGQLSLLMLIEQLELAGIRVISANTDGVTVKCPTHLIATKDAIMQRWQETTGLGLESKRYKAVYARDVNNYIALYEKPDPKEKSAFKYAKAIGAYRQTTDVYPLKWNPTCDVCSEAVIEFLANGTSVEKTIRECDDVRKFIEVRRCTGGGYKDGEYLGKALRWYYSNETTEPIINAKNGNMIPSSTGGRPCMNLPQGIPADLNYDYYIERALNILAGFEAVEDKKAA